MSDKTVQYDREWDQAGFVLLPNPVLFSELSDGAVRVYAALAHHAREKEECWPGQARLAGMIGISEARIRARLRELADAGLIEIRRPGQGRTNRYVLIAGFGRSRTSKNGGLEPPLSNDELEEEKETRKNYYGIEGQAVWNHYLSAFNPRRKEPDAGQRKIIADALKVASVDELRTCIDACAASDFHQQRGDGQKAGRKHNRIGDILKPKRASQYGSGYTQRERIDFWLDRAGSTGGLTEEERERIRSEWVEARNKWAEGLGPDPGPRPNYEREGQ